MATVELFSGFLKKYIQLSVIEGEGGGCLGAGGTVPVVGIRNCIFKLSWYYIDVVFVDTVGEMN